MGAWAESFIETVFFKILNHPINHVRIYACRIFYFLVYLQASPKACLQRIQKRNRDEESSVPMVWHQHQFFVSGYIKNKTAFEVIFPVNMWFGLGSLLHFALLLESSH